MEPDREPVGRSGGDNGGVRVAGLWDGDAGGDEDFGEDALDEL
jgi:hypothetical protein